MTTRIDVLVKYDSDNLVFKIRVQLLSRVRKPVSGIIRVSEEFIANNIDNKRREKYVQEVSEKMVEIHEEEFLTSHRISEARILPWLVEAKSMIEKDK